MLKPHVVLDKIVTSSSFWLLSYALMLFWLLKSLALMLKLLKTSLQIHRFLPHVLRLGTDLEDHPAGARGLAMQGELLCQRGILRAAAGMPGVSNFDGYNVGPPR
jgi:hypothetical protein